MHRSEIIAALGPTNTGKTYRAVVRLLEHESGMIGLPLRLLAREVYDKICSQVGPEHVALVTGEEKRVPKSARYWVCTVEAMPLHRKVEFLAVDEIQLATHLERGHVFTDRLLNARGEKETWFMGSETMRPLVERLVPTARFVTYPRLSQLRAESTFTLGSIPQRSAVVAFSATKVYEIAEKLRARKGGAAVVLGALSPRARNAQVDLYQSGEVEYLVATDAIGMGLNLDIDRVAFAEARKFDGHQLRDLELAELGQIAGRAGRHHQDGSFGTYDRPALPFATQRSIERHLYPAAPSLVWRRPDLDFDSPPALLHSLTQAPRDRALRLVQHAEDTETLKKVLPREEVACRLHSPADLRLLWDICQIPDYRHLLVDEHSHLVSDLFIELSEHGTLRPDFIETHLRRLNGHSGDIEAIMDRIKAVRTWTFVAHQGRWVEHSMGLADRTAKMEDELSDDLHLALVDRFVQKRKRSSSSRLSALGQDLGSDFKSQLAALERRMNEQAESKRNLRRDQAPQNRLAFTLQGKIIQDDVIVGQLRAGNTFLRPRVQYLVDSSPALRHRLDVATKEFVQSCLGTFIATLPEPKTAAERGLLHQMKANMGAARRTDVASLLPGLDEPTKQKWQAQGLVIGRYAVFLQSQVRVRALRHRLALVRCHYFDPNHPKLDPHLVTNSPFQHPDLLLRPTARVAGLPEDLWLKLGFGVVGAYALRLDILEKLLERTLNECGDEAMLHIATTTGLKKRAAQRLASELHSRWTVKAG